MLSLPSAAAAEVLAGVGFDWLFIDAEHGPFDVSSVTGVLQAVDHQCRPRGLASEIGTTPFSASSFLARLLPVFSQIS